MNASTFLPSAPLIYTIAVIRFPRVPHFERFSDEFFDRIREQYPHDERFEQQIFNAEMSAEGFKVVPESQVVWQYLSKNRDCAFLLSSETISFHTKNYKGSNTFFERMKFGLERLAAVPGIGIETATSLGIRYVDLIEPKPGHTLSEYLADWVLPKDKPDPEMSIQEGVYMAKYNTPNGILNFQALRNPPFVIPPDLQSAFLQQNNWIPTRPERAEFAVIDTDHLAIQEQAFISDKLIQTLDNLHILTKNVFKSFGTDFAKEIWGEE